jgi:alanine racemase
MQNPLKLILNRASYPLNRIYISKPNLLHNYQYLSSINPEIRIAPVLKANAYGHGISLVGEVLDEVEAPFLCVDSLYEAYQLQKAGVKTPILIMGFIDPKSLMRKKLPFAYAIYDLKLAKVINEYQPGAEVHIFVDTGMHREGVQINCKVKSEKCKLGEAKCLVHFIEELRKLKNIHLVGLMTHLAIGGFPRDPLTLRQLREFREAIEICEEVRLELKWKHVGGSNAILRNELSKSGANLVRSGLAIYGIDPKLTDHHLKPVLRLATKIIQVKEIDQGESTGYDATFKAQKRMKIGILPIGYYDGVDRRLSNKGSVLVKGVKCPIIGLLSMNMTTVDLSGVKNPKSGLEVLVYSDRPEDPNSFMNTAKICRTTVYDLLAHLVYSTKRELRNH